MPAVSFKEMLHNAFDRRFGVPAFNIVDGLTMQAVLSAAEICPVSHHHPDVRQDGASHRRRRSLRPVVRVVPGRSTCPPVSTSITAPTGR